MSIEVSLTPHKTGRIGIKQGDDPHQLAKNFCKAYSLHKDTVESLTKQLQSHIDKYKKLIEDDKDEKDN